MPKEIRLKPTWRSSSRCQAATESGLDSVVISASAASPNSAPIAPTTEPRSPGLSRVGVPPPKKTVETGRSTSPSAVRARRTSSMADSA
jgi:hypothetical protein